MAKENYKNKTGIIIEKIIKIFFLIIIIGIGFFFIINIYVLGNREAAIEMHEDLAPTASSFMANTKVLITFLTGILNLITALGIIWKKEVLTIAGFIGFILFDGLYIIELIFWYKIHPRIWIDFFIFGSLILIIGIYSFYYWFKNYIKNKNIN